MVRSTDRVVTQQAQTEASVAEPVPLLILPPEIVERAEPTPETTVERTSEPMAEPKVTPEAVPETVREASPEIVEAEKKKEAAQTEQEQIAKGRGRKKTMASTTLKVHRRMQATPERTRVTRSTAKAAESTPVAPAVAAKPPRQTQSKRSAQTEADTGVVPTPVKKPRVTSPSSSKGKGKGKRITELDTAEFLKINFSNDKGELDNTRLERFQGIVTKKEIKPGKVVKIEELKDEFKHYKAVKDYGVFKFLKLSTPFYHTLIRIFYTNVEHKVRSIDPLTKKHWIESSVMGKPIKLTNEVLDKILELPQGGIEWYQTAMENEENHDEDLKGCKGNGDMNFDDRVLFTIITNGLRPIRARTSSINLEDRYFMRCIKSKMPVRWSSFIIHDMHRVMSKKTTYLHYCILLTKVFEYFGIDVSVDKGQMARQKLAMPPSNSMATTRMKREIGRRKRRKGRNRLRPRFAPRSKPREDRSRPR